jgi:hypothetical protein
MHQPWRVNTVRSDGLYAVVRRHVVPPYSCKLLSQVGFVVITDGRPVGSDHNCRVGRGDHGRLHAIATIGSRLPSGDFGQHPARCTAVTTTTLSATTGNALTTGSHRV